MTKTTNLAELAEADRHLLNVALDATANAYAPYSGFAVGAAVLTKSGHVYAGSNLENAAYGVVMCAEVAAVTAANTAGDFEIVAIAVLGHKFTFPRDHSQIVTPCGRCRQIISEAAEIAETDVRIISSNGDLSRVMVSTISEMLPEAFGPRNLGLVEAWPRMQKELRDRVAQLKDPSAQE